MEGKGNRAEERVVNNENTHNGTQASSNKLRVQQYASYLHGITNYLSENLPLALRSLHTTTSSSHQPKEEEKDTILSTTFDRLELPNGERRQCLLLAYVNGFQIWDVQNTENIREIVSKREGPIKCLKFLPMPLEVESAEHPFYEKRPLLAVSSAASETSHAFPNNMLKLYSLRTNDYVNMLRFRTEVHAVHTSRRFIVVALRDHLYAFNAVTMEKVISLNYYGSAAINSSSGIVALGDRWLAYPGTQPLPAAPSAAAPSAANTSSAASAATQFTSDKMLEVAKDVASGLYSLGQKTLAEYIYHSESANSGSASSAVTTESEYAGTVIVYDLVARQPIAHFQAHSQSISTLVFDPTGTLLVTASADGHNFHVFQITPKSATGIQHNYRHLYKLQRGITNATIQDIRFSADSRWLAVSSTRGTTHIFAINPTGGAVNAHTHLRAASSRTNQELQLLLSEQSPHPVVLTALTRIKQSTFEDLLNIKGQFPPIAATAAFVLHPITTDKIFIVTQVGILTLYQLTPRAAASSSASESNGVELSVEPLIEWDICRKTKWSELQTPLFSKELTAQQPKRDNNSASSSKQDQSAESEDQYVFNESIPTRKIEVRHNDPVPFRDGATVDDTHVYSAEPALYNENLHAPSAPPISEDVLKDNIFKAMNTPMSEKEKRAKFIAEP